MQICPAIIKALTQEEPSTDMEEMGKHYMFKAYAQFGPLPYLYTTRHINPKRYMVYTNIHIPELRALIQEEAALTGEQLTWESVFNFLDNLIQKEEVYRRLNVDKPMIYNLRSGDSRFCFYHSEYRFIKLLLAGMEFCFKTKAFDLRVLAFKQKLRAKRIEEINEYIKSTHKVIAKQKASLIEYAHELDEANTVSVHQILGS